MKIFNLQSGAIRKFLLVLLFAEFFNLSSFANPGDTTWVTVYNLRKLTQYGNIDTTAIFPTGKTYRKIRLHYILGRYLCPGNPQYCGSWDYTTQIFARPANNDSVEIAKVITPYASDWYSKNKSHDFVIDVTDYSSVLQGTTGMRFDYEGYSWGFTITLKLEFIEGTPAMEAVKVKNIYSGYFPFGNSTNPIENYLVPKTFSYTAPTDRVFVKNSISGHGADNQNCAEFCNKYYALHLNSTQIATRQLWRNDCGENHVYPQTGTWVYDRGNWCPGAVVWPIYHDLTSLTSANTPFTVNIDMQPYSGSGTAGYNYESQLIHYKAPAHNLDVSIEDIVAPNKDENYFRNNPRCSNPIIKIKNTGTDTVKSVIFSYGVSGGTVLTHTWTGSLAFLQETEAVLPPSLPVLSNTVNATFEVSVTAVNGTTGDDDLFNNIYRSTFVPTSIFPENLVVRFMTNNVSGENLWTLYDEYDTPLVSNSPLSNATVHRDTILGLPPGCYKFHIEDYGCNGIGWWAAPSAGNGALRFESAVTPNGLIYNFPIDFGCSFTKYFRVVAPGSTVGLNSLTEMSNIIEVFPNPAADQVFIKLDLSHSQNVNYVITDVNGRIVREKTLTNTQVAYETISISDLSAGIYLVQVRLADQSTVTKKLVISK